MSVATSTYEPTDPAVTEVSGTTHPPVWRTGVAAGAAAAIATEAYGLVARAAGVTMRAGNMGADHADPITVGMFAMGTLLCTLLGTFIAAVITRRSRAPKQTFLRFAVALTALSLVTPLGAGATGAGTKLMLVGAHIVAAVTVVPALVRALKGARGGAEG